MDYLCPKCLFSLDFKSLADTNWLECHHCKMSITPEDALISMKEVEHPEHYKGNGLEVIQVIEAFQLGFNLGNAIKYILRAGKKGDKDTDLEKARWYLKREMQKPPG